MIDGTLKWFMDLVPIVLSHAQLTNGIRFYLFQAEVICDWLRRDMVRVTIAPMNVVFFFLKANMFLRHRDSNID